LVSSGSAASVWFRALCISAALPSKNRPQPVPPKYHQRTIYKEAKKRERQTSGKKRIASKHSPLLPVLQEIAYTILRVARRVQRFDSNALTELPCFAVSGRLGNGLAVFAANDG
jgi:hypothetical protein